MRKDKVSAIMVKEIRENLRSSGFKFVLILFPAIVFIVIMIVFCTLGSSALEWYVGSDWGFYYYLIFMSFMAIFQVSTMLSVDSFVGESERNTLELLFATPATNLEIFFGKTAASALPGVLCSYSVVILKTATIQFFIAYYGASIAINYQVVLYALIVLPLTSLLTCGLISFSSCIFSSRNLITLFSMITAFLVFGTFSVSQKWILRSLVLMATTIAILLLANVLIFFYGARLFKRERILVHIRD